MMDMPLPEPMGILHDGNGNDPLTFEPWPHDPERDIVCSTMQVFGADQLHALDAQWRAIVAAEVAKEREKCAALCDRFAARDMHPAECAAAIRAGSPGTAPPSEPV